MPIQDRNLAVGTKLVAKYKGVEHGCEVVSEAGHSRDPLRYRVRGQGRVTEEIFGSLSKAGSHVMGGIACNGWRFWSVAGEMTAQDATADAEAEASRAEAQGGIGKGFGRPVKPKAKAKAARATKDAAKKASPVAASTAGSSRARDTSTATRARSTRTPQASTATAEPPTEPPSKEVWCAEHPTREGPFTSQELGVHLGPEGPHGHMMANGAGPPSNRREDVA